MTVCFRIKVHAVVAVALCCLMAVHAELQTNNVPEELSEWSDQGEADSVLMPALVRSERAAKSERKTDVKTKKPKGTYTKMIPRYICFL